MKHLYIFLLLFVFSFANAQTTEQDFKNRYNYAKNLLNEKRFDLAKDAFKPLLERHSNNNFFEFAHFYYAYTAFQLQDYATTIGTLKTVLNSAANLKKHDEICYLLAEALFNKEDFVEAMTYSNKIYSLTLRTQAQNMQANFVKKTNNVSTLKQLYKIYPENEQVSFRLWQLLYAQKDNSNEKKLLDELNKKYVEELAKENKNPAEEVVAPQEQQNLARPIQVAALLPLLIKETEANKAQRKNQFVIDYYYGLLVAQDQLKQEGIEVQIALYDTEKDENRIKKVLQNPTLQNADLIIGPMFPKDAPQIVDFAMKNQICLVNPLTGNAEAIKKYDNAYLTEISSEALGYKAAEYAIKNFSDTTIIYFGNQRQDSVLAHNFANKYKELNGKVPIFKSISSQKNAFKIVSADLASLVGKQTKTAIFVAASDQTIAVNLLSGIQSQNLNLNIITTQEWLDFQQVTYEQLEQTNVNFLISYHIDFGLPAVRAFDTQYIDKSNMIPSRFSYMGHDALFYFVKMIKKYGTNLNKSLGKLATDNQKDEKVEGLLLQGFDYRKGHDNQKLLIGKFKEGKMETVVLE